MCVCLSRALRVCVCVFMDYNIKYNVYNDSVRNAQSLITTLMSMISEVLVLINVELAPYGINGNYICQWKSPGEQQQLK